MVSDAGSPTDAAAEAALTEDVPPAVREGLTRIVLTRHPDQGGALEAGLRAAGFDVTFMPLTEQRLPEDTVPLRQEISRLAFGHYDWLILTSANTVRALHELGWSGECTARTSIAVTGPGTARVLRAYTGIRSPWIPSDRSAAGIVAELPEPGKGAGASSSGGDHPAGSSGSGHDASGHDASGHGRHHEGAGADVLLPQSSAARSELAEGLTARGFVVHRVIAYDTVPLSSSPEGAGGQRLTPEGVAQGHGFGGHTVLGPGELRAEDVVLVTSSTAAQALCQGLLGQDELSHGRGSHGRGGRAVRLIAIGQPTARTLDELGEPAHAVASDPTAAGIIAAVRSARLD